MWAESKEVSRAQLILGRRAFMGDTGFWQLLDGLGSAGHPAIHLDKQGERPIQWQVALSETGRRLLADEVD